MSPGICEVQIKQVLGHWEVRINGGSSVLWIAILKR